MPTDIHMDRLQLPPDQEKTMDASKLAALVEEQNKNPFGDVPEMENDEGNPEPEPASAKERGEELLTSMGDFGEELKESADILVPLAEEIGEDLGGDSEYTPETEEMVAEAVESMPEHIQQGIAENLAGKPKEDLAAVGDALVRSVESETPEGDADPSEAEKVGGLLEVAGECCKELMSGDDEEDDGEGNPDDDMSDMESDDMESNPY